MEQRDQTPEPAAEDIGRAAADAAAQAEQYEGEQYGRGAAGRRSRRWPVVAGVAVAALAVAGTTVAIVGGSHAGRRDTALNAAASSDAQSPVPTTPQSTVGADGTTPESTSVSTSAVSPTKTSTTTSKGSPSTGSSTSAPAGEGGDCETTSHDTPADEARKFSGMTGGTQQAFLAAQKAAQAAGVSFVLNSGYRSWAYQQRIFDCWVKQVGSVQAARQYALPPDQSAHVQGYAMDIAPPSGAAWLESTKGRFGLCRRYADEGWHFEYQARYKTQGCPALVAHP